MMRMPIAIILASLAILSLTVPVLADPDDGVIFNVFGNPTSPLASGATFQHHWAVAPYQYGDPEFVEAVLIVTYSDGLTVLSYETDSDNDWRCARIGQIICVGQTVEHQSDLLVTVRADGRPGQVMAARGLWFIGGGLWFQVAGVRMRGSTVLMPWVVGQR